MQSQASLMASMASMRSPMAGGMPLYNPDGTRRDEPQRDDGPKYNPDGTLRDDRLSDEGTRARRRDESVVPKYNPDGTPIQHDDAVDEETPLVETPPGSKVHKTRKVRERLMMLLVAIVPTAARAWLTFLIASLLTTFMYHHVSGLVIFGLFVAWLVMLRGVMAGISHKAPAQSLFFAVLLLAANAGVVAGWYDYMANMRDFYSLYERRWYTNVLSDELAAAHADASAMSFATGVRPETRLVGGYGSGFSAYCVAPVTGAAGGEFRMGSPVEFWAVGRGCCRGDRFDCWSANDPSAKTGLVLPNRTGGVLSAYLSHETAFYREAIAMACAKYGLNTAEEPMMMYWVKDADVARHIFLTKAWAFWLKAGTLSLTVWIPLAAVVALVRHEIWFGRSGVRV